MYEKSSSCGYPPGQYNRFSHRYPQKQEFRRNTGRRSTTFSFHPVKPITTGQGGIILTNDESLYRKLRLFRSHGITRDAAMLTENEGPWFYEQQMFGYNYRISDIQCALGISQMGKLDRFLKERRRLAERYQEAFADCPDVVTPYQSADSESAWHLYLLQLPYCDRAKDFQKLRESGSEVNVHYIPVYRHPYYREHGYRGVRCENAEYFYAHVMSLPLYPSLTDEKQDQVIDCVRKIVSEREQ